MNAPDELAGILQECLRLTREEGAAIQSAAWPAVTQIQSRKAALRESLAAAAQKHAGGPSLAAFRARAGRIISLLTRNGEALAAQWRQARERQDVLDQAKRNLGRIQRSYAHPQTPAAWHSYS